MTVSDYIKNLCEGQASLIKASQKHLAHVIDLYIAQQPAKSESFPVGSYVLIAYPIDLRSKLANQLKGPFSVASISNSMYQVQSSKESDRLITIHVTRLRQFHYDSTYHISPVEIAATDGQEYAIDYIASHEGSPSRPSDMKFLVHWLGFDDKDADWLTFDAVKDNSTLDQYIVCNIADNPDLALLILNEDRTFHSTINIDNELHYCFKFMDAIIQVPSHVFNQFKDIHSIKNL
jgi:hypothetical protein